MGISWSDIGRSVYQGSREFPYFLPLLFGMCLLTVRYLLRFDLIVEMDSLSSWCSPCACKLCIDFEVCFRCLTDIAGVALSRYKLVAILLTSLLFFFKLFLLLFTAVLREGRNT